jgi:hypothetical protein
MPRNGSQGLSLPWLNDAEIKRKGGFGELVKKPNFTRHALWDLPGKEDP